LAELGSDQVIVAPAESLPSPVVLTAWITKQECSAVDLDQVRQFVDEQEGRGPGTDF
jgi:hypothetical protein